MNYFWDCRYVGSMLSIFHEVLNRIIMAVSVIYIIPILYPSLGPLGPKGAIIFVLIELILGLLCYVVKKVKKWLLPVLGKQLCKL